MWRDRRKRRSRVGGQQSARQAPLRGHLQPLEHAAAPFSESAPGRVNRPEAIRRTAEWLSAEFPDLHMTIEAMIAEGDTVAVRNLSEGTNLGPLNAAWCNRRPSASGPARATGTGSRTASSPSTGPHARTF